jgi:hypothetical protein
MAPTTEVDRTSEPIVPAHSGQRPGPGGGVLAVLLDFAVASLVLDRVAELSRPGAAPLTALVLLRRPLFPAAHPFCYVAPYLTDAELIAAAHEALTAPMSPLARYGRVNLKVTFCRLEHAATALLRQRDYAFVVVGVGCSVRQRWLRRRVESAASSFCTVDVVQQPTGRT